MLRTLRRAALAPVVAGLIAAAASTVAWASFSSSGTASMAVSTAHIFTTTATVVGYDVGDASGGGGEASRPEPAAFTDTVTYSSSSSFQTSFSTTRYLDLTMSGQLASGVAVSSDSFAFDFRSSAAGRTVCFYFQVFNATTSALLETHGSTGTPVACTSSTTVMTTTTPLTAVATTGIADALRVRVFMRSSVAGRGIVDRAAITGSTAYQSFTLEPDLISDCSGGCGTPAAVPARLAAQDTTLLTSAASWPNSFAPTRYIRIGFPPTVPASATISSATLTLALRPSSAASTLCVYLEVYAGATLIGTHGSSSSPAICTTGSSNGVLSVPLAELATAGQANTTQIRVYGRSSPAGRSLFDQANLAVTYSVS
jgi:hypothetical protein